VLRGFLLDDPQQRCEGDPSQDAEIDLRESERKNDPTDECERDVFDSVHKGKHCTLTMGGEKVHERVLFVCPGTARVRKEKGSVVDEVLGSRGARQRFPPPQKADYLK
jgi:hypothetical protein